MTSDINYTYSHTTEYMITDKNISVTHGTQITTNHPKTQSI